MAKLTLNDVVNTYNLTLINDNFDKIEDEFQDKVLYRNNPVGEPNSMLTSLDMNGKRILNLPAPISPNEAARLADISGVGDVPALVAQAEAAADAATLSASNAATSASTASTAASNASASALAASNSATAADGFATQAANFASALISTSSTSTLIGTGPKTFVTQAGKQYNVGQFVTIAQNTAPTNYMTGQVTFYSGNTLTVDVMVVGGSGTFNNWNISISGSIGPQGIQGPQGVQGVPGAGTSVAVSDEGVQLTTAATSMNFVGGGITATNVGNAITVTVPAGNVGTVTNVSVVNANGFNGSVATSTSTPAITLQTTATGVLKGASNALVAATQGTDYSQGTSALATGILKSTTSTGALTIAVPADFPTLNQNTTGTASNVTGTVAVANGGTGAVTLAAKGVLIGNGTSTVGVSNVGTAGQVLTSNGVGNDPSFQNAAGGGGGALTLLTTITPTAVASINLSTIFSSSYDSYLVTVSGLLPASGSANLLFRFSVAGVDDTANNYSSGDFSATTMSAVTSSAQINSTNTIINTGRGYTGKINLENMNSTGSASLKSGIVTAVHQLNLTPAFLQTGRAFTSLNTSAFSGFSLFWSTAVNFQALGTIRVYGYNNT